MMIIKLNLSRTDLIYLIITFCLGKSRITVYYFYYLQYNQNTIYTINWQLIIIYMQESKSQEFEPQSLSKITYENCVNAKKRSKAKPGQKQGKWSDLEHAKYIVFIQAHREEFKSKKSRRTNKFYKLMSQFVKSRNAMQCRSHHQKLEQKYIYPNRIITLFKSKDNLPIYEAIKQELRDFQSRPIKIQQSGTRSEIGCQTNFKGIDINYVLVYDNSYMLYGLGMQSIFPMNSIDTGMLVETHEKNNYQNIQYPLYQSNFF